MMIKASHYKIHLYVEIMWKIPHYYLNILRFNHVKTHLQHHFALIVTFRTRLFMKLCYYQSFISIYFKYRNKYMRCCWGVVALWDFACRYIPTYHLFLAFCTAATADVKPFFLKTCALPPPFWHAYTANPLALYAPSSNSLYSWGKSNLKTGAREKKERIKQLK